MSICSFPLNYLKKVIKYFHKRISIYFAQNKSILMFGPHQKYILYELFGETRLSHNYEESGVSEFVTSIFKTNFTIYQTENIKSTNSTNKLTELVCIFYYKTDIIIYTIDIRNTKEEMAKHKSELHDIVKTNFYLKIPIVVIGINHKPNESQYMNIPNEAQSLKADMMKTENIIHLLELMRFKGRPVACFVYENSNINLIRNWICKQIKNKKKKL